MKFSPQIFFTIILCMFLPVFLFANIETQTVALNYISPDELIEALVLRNEAPGVAVFQSENESVQVRLNQATNELLLTGEPSGIAVLKGMIQQLDVPPRQFVIEAQIVEIDNQKSREVGLDWQYALQQINLQSSLNWMKNNSKIVSTTYGYEHSSKNDRTDKQYSTAVRQGLTVGDFLNLVDESGAGKITNVPRIVTTNNQEGTIFDGKKIKYVVSLSTFANIYQTEELASGLMLAVTPSLGKSGYLKLKVNAKLTFLEMYHSNGRNSPVETGQSLENVVIMKDGESLFLGGFKRTEKYQVKKKVPFLGTILPFLFSKKYDVEGVKDVLIIITPKVIDLNLPKVNLE